MGSGSVSQRVADIAVSQWGMVTTAQARLHGIARANIAYRVRVGALERTGHSGVYRLAAVPTNPLDDVRAAWLSTNPRVLAPLRTQAPRPDAVVAAGAAALVHGIGDVYPAPYRIIVPSRRQSANDGIAYSWRPLDSNDVEIVDGLPVTTRERTVVDLLCDEGDISIAADALRDAVRSGFDPDETHLEMLLAPHAERFGRSQGDGPGALAYLMATAGVDAVSEANRALDRVAQSNVPLPGTEALVEKMILTAPALASTMPRFGANA